MGTQLGSVMKEEARSQKPRGQVSLVLLVLCALAALVLVPKFLPIEKLIPSAVETAEDPHDPAYEPLSEAVVYIGDEAYDDFRWDRLNYALGFALHSDMPGAPTFDLPSGWHVEGIETSNVADTYSLYYHLTVARKSLSRTYTFYYHCTESAYQRIEPSKPADDADGTGASGDGSEDESGNSLIEGSVVQPPLPFDPFSSDDEADLDDPAYEPLSEAVVYIGGEVYEDFRWNQVEYVLSFSTAAEKPDAPVFELPSGWYVESTSYAHMYDTYTGYHHVTVSNGEISRRYTFEYLVSEPAYGVIRGSNADDEA